MKALRLHIDDFRQFKDCEVVIGNKVTAIAGNNGTGKSTILGLLANSSHLRRYKTYLGKPFRGEFSELFSATQEHDPSGGKASLDYMEKEQEQTVRFRTSWQDDGTRFRVIPKRELANGKTSEAKLNSPVIYLGLSRLYPFGEADKGALRQQKQHWDSDDDYNWFIDKYKEILSIHTEIESVNSFDIAHSRKHGTGVNTGSYDSVANSAGQDNLGQILMAVLSFKKLKRDMKDEWDGGLLLIDEIDATLHPAAQRRLIDLLLKEAGKCGFQVVFTTHSTVVLEYLVDKTGPNVADRPNDIEIAYLTDANRRLEIKRNPAWHTIISDLFVKGAGSPASKVGVFSEDDEARWLMREIIGVLYPELLNHVNFIDVRFGCLTLIHLYKHDYLYMKDRIIVLDGDVTEEQLSEIPGSYRANGKNVLKLPGSVRPEKVIWDFLVNADVDDPVWEALNPYDLTYRSITENGPMTSAYSQHGTERNRYKAWLKDCEPTFKQASVIKFWIDANPGEAWTFIEEFTEAYNQVAQRTSASLMPMAMKPENL